MSMPDDLPIIDLMLSLPILDTEKTYGNLRAAAKDKESKDFEFPAEYMFKGVPHGWGEGRDPVEVTLEEMDKWGIQKALIGVGQGPDSQRAIEEHPDRFLGNIHVDPNDIMGAVRAIEAAKDRFDIRMASTFPAGNVPQIPVDGPQMYPLYAKCVELDIAVGLNMGGPRASCPDGLPEGRAPRSNLLRLSRATPGDLPRLRAVGGAGDQVDVEVARALLLHERLRPEALSGGDRPIREYAGRRQDSLRRILPDGPLARTHHDRDARCSLSRSRLAEVSPRERAQGPQGRRLTGTERE